MIVGWKLDFGRMGFESYMEKGLIKNEIFLLIFPSCRVRVISAFKWFGIQVFRISDKCPTIGTYISEFTILANLHLIFRNAPAFPESIRMNDRCDCVFLNVSKWFLHGRAILDIPFYIYPDFSIQAGVEILCFGK